MIVATINPFAPGIGSRPRGREIVMLVVSDLRIDPRVEREARALAAAGYAIRIICPDVTYGAVPNLKIDWGEDVLIEFLPGASSEFANKYPGFMAAQIFAAAMKYRPFAFHAHDLNTGYAALAAARTTGAHLVADFHEWTSENVHWDSEKNEWIPYSGDWKELLQDLERRILRDASAVVTVCDSIADAMAVELGNGRKPVVIRNIPNFLAMPTQEYASLKQQLGLLDDAFVVLYQGGTGATRLLEPIIEALEFAPRATLVIRGPSLDVYGPGYRSIAERISAHDRLILVPGVPSRDVVAAARGANAGIWSLPALCRNFTYALPNKIFEYVSAALPVLVADYPESRRLVEENRVGLTFDPYNPKSIAAAINRMIDDPTFMETCRKNTATALASIDAKAEWRKLVVLYDALPRCAVQDGSL